MVLKGELITWHEAVTAFDNQDFERALTLFTTIADTAKMHFNVGIIFSTLQEHEAAIKSYNDALEADQYFALAYFQKGVSNFLMGEFEDAIEDFDDALLCLRGNLIIDYEQIGLDYKLFSCEILYNRGLCHIFLEEADTGITDFVTAQKEKQSEDHDVIDQALNEGVAGLSVFSLPQGLLYRPPQSIISNVDKVNYLGSSKLIAAVASTDMYIGFKGAHLRKVSEGDTPFQAPPPRSRSQSVANQYQRKNPDLATSDIPPKQRRATEANIARPLPPRVSSVPGSINGRRRGSNGKRGFSENNNHRRPSFTYSEGNTGRKLKVKCHYTDKRVVVCDSNISFRDLVTKIEQKFESPKRLRLKYMDEDGELVLMTDQEDMDVALGLVGGVGSSDRLEVWCCD